MATYVNTRKGLQLGEGDQPESDPLIGKTVGEVSTVAQPYDPLWTPEQVAKRLNASPDWVRDHSSRKEPRLPVIRLGGGPGRAGLLRYRASQIEKFSRILPAIAEVGSSSITRRLLVESYARDGALPRWFTNAVGVTEGHGTRGSRDS